jgi:hypothetical protein
MKIPKKLKIGGHIVKIEQGDFEGDFLGRSDTTENVIKLQDKMCQSQKEATLLHETLHFLNTTWGDTLLGHIALNSIGEQLYQVLKDNKLIK